MQCPNITSGYGSPQEGEGSIRFIFVIKVGPWICREIGPSCCQFRQLNQKMEVVHLGICLFYDLIIFSLWRSLINYGRLIWLFINWRNAFIIKFRLNYVYKFRMKGNFVYAARLYCILNIMLFPFSAFVLSFVLLPGPTLSNNLNLRLKEV